MRFIVKIVALFFIMIMVVITVPNKALSEDVLPIATTLNPFLTQQARFSNVQYSIYPSGYDLSVPLITEGNIQVGPFKIHPHMGLAESYTDNVNRTDTTFGGRTSDWYTTYAPGLQVQLPFLGRHMFILDYRTNLERYSRDQSLNVDDQTGSMGLVFDFPGGLTVKGLLEGKDGHDYRGSATSNLPGAPAGVNKFWNTEYGVEAQLQSQAFIRARAKYIGWQFYGPLAGSASNPGNFGDINTRNRVERYASFAAGGQVASKTYLYLEGLLQKVSYLINTPLDSTIYTGTMGVKWEATAKSTGDFQVGWQNRVMDQASTRGSGTYSGLYFNGAMQWKPQTQTQVNWAVYRRTNETVLSQTRFFTATGTTVDASHAVTMKWHITGQFMFEHDSYSDPITAGAENAIRQDNYTTLGGGLLYQIQPWLGARLNYLHTQRLSNFISVEYNANQAMLSLQAQF